MSMDHAECAAAPSRTLCALRFIMLVWVGLASLASACALEREPQTGGADLADARGAPLTDAAACEDRALEVEALLADYCAGCHGNGNAVGGFNHVLMHEQLIATRKIVPGEPEASQLYMLVESGFMPRTERKPSPDEIANLRAWIECGAPRW